MIHMVSTENTQWKDANEHPGSSQIPYVNLFVTLPLCSSIYVDKLTLAAVHHKDQEPPIQHIWYRAAPSGARTNCRQHLITKRHSSGHEAKHHIVSPVMDGAWSWSLLSEVIHIMMPNDFRVKLNALAMCIMMKIPTLIDEGVRTCKWTRWLGQGD